MIITPKYEMVLVIIYLKNEIYQVKVKQDIVI